MQVTLPLDKMMTQEKLCALEEIWDDLAREKGSERLFNHFVVGGMVFAE